MIIYLYKKTHNKTGLQYLGKTIQDPFTYKGSGDYWVPHIKKHGYDVTTEIIKECTSVEELKHWGLYYSTLWNIVDDRDEAGNKKWANLKPEEGQGFATGKHNPMHKTATKEKHKQAINDEAIRQKRQATLRSDECRQKRQLTEQDPETKARRRQAQKISQNRPEVKEKLSGPNNYRYDHTVYTFVHASGMVEHCTRRHLINNYNLDTGRVSLLINGTAKQHKGWRLLPTL